MKNAGVARSAAWLLLGVLSAASMAFYVRQIWSANQPPGFSDLYAPWWAAHEILLHRRNPYTPSVAHEIQTVIYGAAVAPSSGDPSGIAGGFAYPPYAALPLGPTVGLSFPAAQRVFVIAGVIVTLLSLGLWMRMLRFRTPLMQGITLAFFALGSFPAMQAFKLQNLSVIAAALLTVTVALTFRQRYALAGIVLGASTFKPQFVVALIPWLIIWTLADWRRRRSLALSFLATVVLLFLLSELLVPGWLPEFINVVRAYRHYTYGHSLLDVWFTPAFGIVASFCLLTGALAFCWPYRREPSDSPRFFVVISLLLAATVLVIPTLAPHAQLLLLPGFLCLLGTVPAASGIARLFQVSAWFLLAWVWIAALGLWIASWLYPLAMLHRFWQMPLYTSPLLPLAVLLALGGRLRSPASAVHEPALAIDRKPEP